MARSRLLYLVPALIALTAFGADAAPQPTTSDELTASPPGVRLRVIRIGYGVNPAGSNSNQPRDRIVFATSENRVLYSSKNDAPGVSNCDAECAKTWIPFAVDDGAKPVGEWSVVARADGAKQWAYRDMPMYTYAPEAEEKPPVTREERSANADADKQAAKPTGNAQAGAAAAALNAAKIPPAKNTEVKAGDATKNVSPQAAAAAANLGRQGGEGRGHDVDGHQVMELQPQEWNAIPAGIEVREVRAAAGQVLTTAEKSLPLYALTGGKADDASLNKDWSPMIASQLSLPVGDFTIVARKDGQYQWAYKGGPLFTYKGDLDYGDAYGIDADPRLKLVYLLKYYTPPGVQVVKNRQYGGLFATAEGHILYARESSNGGSDGALRGDRGRPATGEKIGLSGCDTECEKVWKPLLAADDAKPTGYWTLFDRPDGKKQWAYFGYALYSHASDAQPDTSTEIYDAVAHYEIVDNTPNKSFPLHWRVAPP